MSETTWSPISLASSFFKQEPLDLAMVIGSGDFVVSVSHVDIGGIEMAVMDIFRVAGAKIVEHWDVMEEIAPEAEWANSGKF